MERAPDRTESKEREAIVASALDDPSESDIQTIIALDKEIFPDMPVE